MTRILVTIGLALTHPAFGAEPTWGAAINGLRMGLTAAPSEPVLIVVFENIDAVPRDVPIGGSNAPTINVTFRARDAKANTCEVLNLTGDVGAGLILPVTLRVDPGERREVRLPMKRLICIQHRVDIPLDTLLKQGFSVRAALDELSIVSGDFHMSDSDRGL